MKELNKGNKKALIWCASILGGLLLCGCIVNLVAKQQLRSALANIPGATFSIDKVHLSLLAGNVELKNVDFSLRDTTDAGPDIAGSVASLKLKHIHWFRLFKGEAKADKLVIRKPEAQVLLKKQKETQEPDTTQAQESFLKKVALSQLRIENGQFALKSQADSTKVSAQEINFSLDDIAIDLKETAFAFNDSTYRVSLDSLDYLDGQALSRIQLAHLATADAGPIDLRNVHLYNCVPQEQLAVRLGKVAAMWYDVQLDTVTTSPLNIPRMINSQRIAIESVGIAGSKAVILQDDRYPPAVPYPTIQEGLNTLEWPLHINQIDASFTDFTFIWETTHVNRGAFPMRFVKIGAQSVSNAPNNVMGVSVKSGRPGHSRMNFSASIRNDKRESTRGKLQVYDLDASKLDSFIGPLFGATARASIHKIDCSFNGDKSQMTNDFCMIYDNLSATASSDATAPFQLVAKNSGLVNFLARMILPKANPSAPGKEPKRVEVTFKRNPMQPYPAYLIQNLTNGMLHTVLPGGEVRKTKK